MDELSQWCEIDGHEWITSYLSYGLVLYSKITETHKICRNCKKSEKQIFVPHGHPVYIGPIIIPEIVGSTIISY